MVEGLARMKSTAITAYAIPDTMARIALMVRNLIYTVNEIVIFKYKN